jgi:CDGSH-type Zn-finger protein
VVDPLPDESPDDAPAGAAPTEPAGRGATVTPYRDGPLIVRGEFRLLDQDGNEIDPGRDTIALCRCGRSAIKPFCDGTHKRSGFTAPSAPRRPRPVSHLRPADEDPPG